MFDPEYLASVARKLAVWESVEHWGAIVVVAALAIEVIAGRLQKPLREELDRAHEEQVATLNEQANQARLEQEQLKADNLALEEALSPRLLEQAQSADALRTFAGTKFVVAAVPDFEARRLAEQITFMLKLAEWTETAEAVLPDERDGVTVEYVAGASLEGREDIKVSGDRRREAATALLQQLQANHIDARPQWIPFIAAARGDVRKKGPPPETIVVYVGLRPIGHFIEKRMSGQEGKVIFGNR